MPFRRRSLQQITWLILTNKTVQENTDKQTQYKSEKVNNLKYSKTKLPWFSCLLQHSARKRGGLILQRSRAHTGPVFQGRQQVSKYNFINAHNGQQKPNLRRKMRGVKWIGRPAGSSGSWGYVSPLKQKMWKRCYYLAAHRRVVSVLTSNSTFLNGVDGVAR